MSKSIFALLIMALSVASCTISESRQVSAGNLNYTDYQAGLYSLQDSIDSIAESYPGDIGIVLITDRGDTLAVNDTDKYPLMSVFKLHQAISLCHALEQRGASTDSVVTIESDELNPSTWSPMLKEHNEPTIHLSIKDLMRYTLTMSDNNASNYMFQHMQSVAEADSFIATIIPRECFRMVVTEADMWADHNRSRDNHSSPSGAAILIDRLFTDSIIGQYNRDFLCATLRECTTGTDRIVAPLSDIEGVTVAHKTGSGFRDGQGRLMAHNDVAFIVMPDGRHYSLAVLVTNFDGSEEEASAAIAKVSETVYNTLSALKPQQ